MPKKFQGGNTKAVEARARKAASKDAETERRQQQLEDEYWQESDKNVLKKLQRKEEKEKKRVDQQERKKEIQRLADEEIASIKSSSKPAASVSTKLTRAEIESNQQKMMGDSATGGGGSSMSSMKRDDIVCVDDLPLEENLNRLSVDGLEARTVDEAIRVLSDDVNCRGGGGVNADVDKHPEKRMKAAYLAFEERHLSRLKSENPNLRLSQLKQMLKKDWNKSPENPLNQ